MTHGEWYNWGDFDVQPSREACGGICGEEFDINYVSVEELKKNAKETQDSMTKFFM